MGINQPETSANCSRIHVLADKIAVGSEFFQGYRIAIKPVSSGAQFLAAVDAIGERLGKMVTADRRGTVEIGNRARELQDAVEAAGGKIEPF